MDSWSDSADGSFLRFYDMAEFPSISLMPAPSSKKTWHHSFRLGVLLDSDFNQETQVCAQGRRDAATSGGAKQAEAVGDLAGRAAKARGRREAKGPANQEVAKPPTDWRSVLLFSYKVLCNLGLHTFKHAQKIEAPSKSPDFRHAPAWGKGAAHLESVRRRRRSQIGPSII